MTRSLAPDKENAIRAFDLMLIPARGYAIATLLLDQSWAPHHLHTVRVYELNPRIPFGVEFKSEAPEAPDAELDVLRDVLLDQQYDRARDLVRGWAGPWRATTAKINLRDIGSNSYLLDRVSATSAWWLNLDCNAPPNNAYELCVENAYEVETMYRADLIFGPGVW